MDHLLTQIKPQQIQGRVKLGGSKSISNRVLLLAALAKGTSILTGLSDGKDTQAMLQAIAQLGAEVNVDPDNHTVHIRGLAGRLHEPDKAIEVYESATCLRFLLAACACMESAYYRFHLGETLLKRPHQGLLDALRATGSKIHENFPYMELEGHGICVEKIVLDTGISSQYASALLMAAPLANRPFKVVLNQTHLEQKPYIQMTRSLMQQWGIETLQKQEQGDVVLSAQKGCYQARSYQVEADYSSASYFFVAALLAGGQLQLGPFDQKSLQGDKRIVEIARLCGADIRYQEGYYHISCDTLQAPGLDLDLRTCSDLMMALAVLAPFLQSKTTLCGIAHTQFQESRRIDAMVAALQAVGVRVEQFEDALCIYPGAVSSASIDSCGDHRLAMACSLWALTGAHITIKDAQVVEKTCPRFYEHLASISSVSYKKE